MTLTEAEREMWEVSVRAKRTTLTDAEINEKYERGEGRIVVESNREKLPGFAAQLKNTKYMDVRPFYQRRPRWDVTRQSRLIESFLINLPVPPVFLYEKEFNSYEVMDGQQRISAIRDFYENKFPLTDLQHWPELEGRYYHNLPSMVKAGIDRRSISSIVMLKESAPQDEEALLLRQIVFERLNTGGVELERQEIRNALFPGVFNELLLELSRNSIIRRAWKLPEYHPDELTARDKILVSSNFFQKMEDAELVLRFFALRNAEHYTRGMQGFLDIYMMRAASFSEETISALKVEFNDAISLASEIYGEHVFSQFDVQSGHWSDRPQKAVFDAVMVALSENARHRGRLVERREDIIVATANLFRAHEEGTFTGRQNSKRDVQNRISLMSNMFNNFAV
ncbi:DUF262 domain-containing protein [Sphingomonas sp. RT2P30]|uniref:DUF262 domain-containing protein n=1 Tax=Parasphingomonas halimpatiens TaxID=3096162 RepID=UPI002FC63F25